jgi:glycosyltransferase involved in cell wall biosynthesis
MKNLNLKKSSTENKRIAFILPTLQYGGAELQTINQVNYLYDNVYKDVFLIILSNDTNSDLLAQCKLPRSNVFILNTSLRYLSQKSIIKSLNASKALNNLIVLNKINLLVANLPIAHFVARLAKVLNHTNIYKRRKLDLVVYHRSMQYDESPLLTRAMKIFNVFHSILARFTDSCSICISNEVKRNIEEEFFVGKSFIVYDAIEKNMSTKLEDKITAQGDCFKIVVPGRINSAKGQLFFADAIKDFIKMNHLTKDDIHITFAGDGDLKDKLLEELNRFNIKEYTSITGYLMNVDLLDEMLKADLVVVPSLQEGLGNVAMEALMLGCRILSSDAGGLKEVIVDNVNGYLFHSGNKNIFLDKLNGIYYDKVIHLETTNIKQSFNEKFSFDSHIERILQIIEECAA